MIDTDVIDRQLIGCTWGDNAGIAQMNTNTKEKHEKSRYLGKATTDSVECLEILGLEHAVITEHDSGYSGYGGYSTVVTVGVTVQQRISNQ